MSCRFDCAKCGYSRAIQPFYAGKSVLCPECGHASTVPSGSVSYEIPALPVSIAQRPAPAPSEMSFRAPGPSAAARPSQDALFEGDLIEPEPSQGRARATQIRSVPIRDAVAAYRAPARAPSAAWEAARQVRQAVSRRSQSSRGYGDLWFLVSALACTWFADTVFFAGGGSGGIGVGAIFCVAFILFCLGAAVYRVAARHERSWVPVVAAFIAAFSLGVYSIERPPEMHPNVGLSAPRLPDIETQVRAEARKTFEPGGMGWGHSPPRFERITDGSANAAMLNRVAAMVEDVSPKVIEGGVVRFVLPEDHEEFLARLAASQLRELETLTALNLRYVRFRGGFNIIATEPDSRTGTWRMVLSARPKPLGGFSRIMFEAA